MNPLLVSVDETAGIGDCEDRSRVIPLLKMLLSHLQALNECGML